MGNHFSRHYVPANGLLEAFSKTLYTFLEKLVDKNKKTWLKKLPEALWAYSTTVKIMIHVTLYYLVFGGETVHLLEIQIPSLRVAVHGGITMKDKANLRLAELETLD